MKLSEYAEEREHYIQILNQKNDSLELPFNWLMKGNRKESTVGHT